MDSEVFETSLIKNVLEYKWKKVRCLGYLFTLIYLGYLLCIAYTDHWLAIVLWFAYFILIEMYQLYSSGDEDGSCFEACKQWARGIWNWVDLIRLLATILVIAFGALDDTWTIARQ